MGFPHREIEPTRRRLTKALPLATAAVLCAVARPLCAQDFYLHKGNRVASTRDTIEPFGRVFPGAGEISRKDIHPGEPLTLSFQSTEKDQVTLNGQFIS